MLVSVGCSLGSTDRRVNALLKDYSEDLHSDAAIPKRVYKPAEAYRNPDQTSKKVETVNPSAKDLPFNQAAADRDVVKRLDQYADLGYEGQLIDLADAFRIAQTKSREFQTAEEEYILAAIRLLIEQHRYGPRFFNDTSVTAAGTFDTTNDDTAVRIVNELRATQQLPYGGNVEARLIWNSAELLRRNVAGNYSSASSLVIDANIPLLRNAGAIAQESLIQAERNLVYAARDFERFRRQFLVDIARDFFNLMAQQSVISNQQRSMTSLGDSQRRTAARVAAGREAAFETRRFEERVLATRNGLISARERYLLSLDRFKVRLGLPVEKNIIIVPTELVVPEPEITPERAVELALENRLDLQTIKDQLNDARRAVANSKNQLLPDLDLAAGLTSSTKATKQTSNFDLDFGRSAYNASVTFGLPLDREIERLNLRSSMISMERATRGYEQFRDNVIVGARSSVRDIDEARFSVDLAERRVEIGRLVLEQLRLEEAESLQITDAEDQRLQSENDRDSAVRDLRVAVLQHLLSTGMMRVDREGQFIASPGMGKVEARPINTMEEKSAADDQKKDANALPARPGGP